MFFLGAKKVITLPATKVIWPNGTMVLNGTSGKRATIDSFDGRNYKVLLEYHQIEEKTASIKPDYCTPNPSLHYQKPLTPVPIYVPEMPNYTGMGGGMGAGMPDYSGMGGGM